MSSNGRQLARYLLALIRIVNGGLALFFPKRLLKDLGVEDEPKTGSIYALRLFGIRTILIGLELLFARGEHLEGALKVGVVIHASDTVSAAVAGITHELPRKGGIMATAISAFNTFLALAARGRA